MSNELRSCPKCGGEMSQLPPVGHIIDALSVILTIGVVNLSIAFAGCAANLDLR